jgi:peroxiredoxin
MSISGVKKFLLAGAMLALFIGQAGAEEIEVGDTAPGFSLKDVSGKDTITLEQYRGKKIVYLDFYATWCPTCREEMAWLKEIHNTYRKEGLEVIAINVKETAEKVNKFIAKYELPFTMLLDEKAEVAKRYNLVGFPYNVMIDGNGKIVYMGSQPPRFFEKMFNDSKDTIKAAPAK